MKIGRTAIVAVLSASLVAALPAFGSTATPKTLLTLSGTKTASASVVINSKFSLSGLTVTTKGTYAGYELKDRHGAVAAWGFRLPNGDIAVETSAAWHPAGTYQVTLLTDGRATVSIKALTAAPPHKTLTPHGPASFTFASQTVSSAVEGVARTAFTVPQRYALAVHIVAVTRGTDVGGYEKDCITTNQVCETSYGAGFLFTAPAGPGSSDTMTLQADYQPGDLHPGAATAIVEYAAASGTASATSAILVFS